MHAQTNGKKLPFLREDILSWALAAGGVCILLLAGLMAPDWAVAIISPACAIAALASCALLAKSIRDFSRTGPAVRKEITGRFDPNEAPKQGEDMELNVDMNRACLFDPSSERLMQV